MVRSVVALALVGACGRISFDPLSSGDGGTSGGDDSGDASAPACTTFGPFGAPMTDPVLNSAATDWGPSLSRDGLTIVFSSSRNSAFDRLYVSTRATVQSAWSTPTQLAEIAPGVIADDPSIAGNALTLYWGNPQVQYATRPDTNSSWTPMGTALAGTTDHNILGGPDISPDELTLYATGMRNSDSTMHIYEAHRARKSDPFTTSTEVLGLGSESDYGSMRSDGLEIAFQRVVVSTDLFHAFRASVTVPFDPPVPITELNSSVEDGDLDFSEDGTTAWFTSQRPGGLGSWDLWFATRTCQ